MKHYKHNPVFFFFEHLKTIHLYYKKNFFFITLHFINNLNFLTILKKIIIFNKQTITDFTQIESLPKIKLNKLMPLMVMFNYVLKNYFLYIFLKTPLQSAVTLFKSILWLEREVKEFYGTIVLNTPDSRNLLLDYNKEIAPLLKIFPVNGVEEIFFNFNNYNLLYINSSNIEL